MSFSNTIKFVAVGAFVAISAAAHAENAVVLESFESGITCSSLYTNEGGRPLLSPPGVQLTQYTAKEKSDSKVTNGKSSLRVQLSGRDKFSADFQVALSAEASAKVRKAAASGEVARYVLRYDVIFPPMEDFVYFNTALHLGDSRDVLISNGGKRTMSVALDLLSGIPQTGPLTLFFVEDFGAKAKFTNTVIYIDNIRLVDTYAPGAKPVVNVLQSFEDPAAPLGGATNFTVWDDGSPKVRVSLAQYTASSPSDLHVSEGTHALKVTYTNNPGAWHADFILPLASTKLAEVLKLDLPPDSRPTPQQLARYTLRWDVTYPDVVGDDWMNITYHTTDSFLPIIQVRKSAPKGQRQTYSISLDQIQWGNFNDLQPVLAFISEGPHKEVPVSVFYDNFRLIDTGNATSGQSHLAGAQ